MRPVTLCVALLFATVLPASAQLRVRDFGFGAAMALDGNEGASPQVNGALTLQLKRHALELAGGAGAGDEFLSLNPVWYLGALNVGAGPAVHVDAHALRPALAGRIALEVPFAPRRAAALRLVARMIAVSGGPRLSLGAGLVLAPFNGGIRLGEDAAAPLAQADVARSWEAVIAQVMLLDDASSFIEDVMATQSALSLRFAAGNRADVMMEVSRVARILSAGIDVHQLVITAPEPSWVRAAATAGGFPAERIVARVNDGALTIQATRVPDGLTIRSARP